MKLASAKLSQALSSQTETFVVACPTLLHYSKSLNLTLYSLHALYADWTPIVYIIIYIQLSSWNVHATGAVMSMIEHII